VLPRVVRQQTKSRQRLPPAAEFWGRHARDLDRESAHTAKRFNMILVPAELPRRGRGALN